MPIKTKLTKTQKEEKLFKKRIGSIYGNMKRRLLKLGYGEILFSREALYVKMSFFLNERLCKYCQGTLRAKNFSVDHAVPLSRTDVTFIGKRKIKSLENLEGICARCNRAKSELTSSEFEILLGVLNDPVLMSAAAKRSVLMRLAAAPPWLR